MECEEVRKYIYAFLDDELDVERNLDVLEHINICAECGERFSEEKHLGLLIRQSLLCQPRPEGIRTRLYKKVVGASPTPRKKRRLPGALFLPVSTIICVAALAVAGKVFIQAFFPVSQSSLMAASVDRHEKYLRDELPMEILSQDPEVVARHFSAKLGISFPVRSLSDEQFRLVGGRLCHLMGSPAAWVVYERPAGTNRSACTLSLYMLSDGPPLSLGEATKVEDNLLTGRMSKRPVVIWRHAGLVSALVGDGLEEEVIRLARLMQTPPPQHAGNPLHREPKIAGR